MKFLLLISMFFVGNTLLSAQDTAYYYGADFGISSDRETAKFTRKIDKKYGKRYVVKTYMLDGEEWVRARKEKIRIVNDTLMQIRRKSDKFWAEVVTRTFHPAGKGRYYFTDRKRGNILLEGYATSVLPLHLEDTVKSYYDRNRPKSIAVYHDNSLVSNQNWLRNGNKYYDNLHYFVDQEPEHSLGQVHFRTYMLQGIQQSGIDLNQISDRVIIGWVIMEDGSLEGFHTIKGVYTQLNNTLIKLIMEMPGEWQPATLNGKPVRYYMNMPFNFIDRSENFENLELSTGFVSWD